MFKCKYCSHWIGFNNFIKCYNMHIACERIDKSKYYLVKTPSFIDINNINCFVSRSRKEIKNFILSFFQNSLNCYNLLINNKEVTLYICSGSSTIEKIDLRKYITINISVYGSEFYFDGEWKSLGDKLSNIKKFLLSIDNSDIIIKIKLPIIIKKIDNNSNNSFVFNYKSKYYNIKYGENIINIL